MKSALTHLPQRKRGEIARIVNIIRQSLPCFFTVFPLRTRQERDRFDLLRQAYVGARCHDDYKITPQKLKYLARCVELLRDQVELSCQEKMGNFVS